MTARLDVLTVGYADDRVAGTRFHDARKSVRRSSHLEEDVGFAQRSE